MAYDVLFNFRDKYPIKERTWGKLLPCLISQSTLHATHKSADTFLHRPILTVACTFKRVTSPEKQKPKIVDNSPFERFLTA